MIINVQLRRPFLNTSFSRSFNIKLPDSADAVGSFLSWRIKRALGVALLSFDMEVANVCVIRSAFKKYYRYISTEDMHRLFDFGVFSTENPPDCPIIDKVWVQGGFRYLPPARMEHVTCREWMYMNEYLDKYLDGDQLASYSLLALLARPRIDSDADDPRDKLLTRAAVAREAKKLIRSWRWYYFARGACLYYALSMRHFIMNIAVYKQTIFKKPENQNPRRIHFGWYENFLHVAESGVFGESIENVLDAKFHDVAVYLVSKHQEAEDYKYRSEKKTIQ